MPHLQLNLTVTCPIIKLPKSTRRVDPPRVVFLIRDAFYLRLLRRFASFSLFSWASFSSRSFFSRVLRATRLSPRIFALIGFPSPSRPLTSPSLSGLTVDTTSLVAIVLDLIFLFVLLRLSLSQRSMNAMSSVSAPTCCGVYPRPPFHELSQRWRTSRGVRPQSRS